MSASFRSTFRPIVYLIALLSTCANMAQGERVYIMNGGGYNRADEPLVAAIESLGHSVDVSSNLATDLPDGFTSACIDPENGYHWLCFYSAQVLAPLVPEVQAFINAGGKVLLQYEVVCCPFASLNAALMASAITGLSITPNAADYIAFYPSTNVPGWEAISSTGCLNARGNAYKCMDGIPPQNALNATANLNNSSPPITDCPNFGFVFRPEDLPGQSGGVVGFGDINLYYANAGEPPNNGGIQPVDMNVVELIFGSSTSKCTLLPSGCLSTAVEGPPSPLLDEAFPNPADQQLSIRTSTVGAMEIMVINAVGQVISSSNTQGDRSFSLSTSGMSAGIYRLVLRREARQEAVTFVVEH